MWLLEEIQNHAFPSGISIASPSAAFTELDGALKHRKDLDDGLNGAIIAAITGAASCAWPPKLLQRTLDILFNAVEGTQASIVGYRTTLSSAAHL